MKVAIIGTNVNSILGFRSELIKMLYKNNHKVYVFAIDYNEYYKKKLQELGAIPIEYNLERTGVNPFYDLYCSIKLSIKIKKISPDILFSFFSKPCIYGTLAGVLANVKNRYSMLEGLGYTFTEQKNGSNLKQILIKKLQVFLYKLTIPKLNSIIFLNEDDKKDLIDRYNIKAKKTHILGGIGVNIDKYSYSIPPTDKISFIFIARLLLEKGVYDYINAAKIVKANHPETIFYLLGDIDSDNPGSISQEELTQLINENIVIAPGHVTNVEDWIEKSSIFVLPSYYREGVPRSTQEAMSMGRPILTTNVPGCKDTVIHGMNGYLIERWNYISLAEKMMYLIENPQKIISMGKYSHQLALERYNVENVNKRLIEILSIPNDN